LWRALDDKAAYAAPMIGEVAGERQLLVVSALRLMGLRIESGKLLWEFPWTTSNDINVAQPLVVDESQVFISAGYGHGAALIEVSAQKGYEIRVVWENVSMKNKFTSSVLHEGYIYGLDEAILACIDARTGERKWKGGRYGYGQLLLASGHLVVLTEGGDLALVRATPEKFDERARIPAIEGKTWNHPAIADGILLVRNLREMAAFDLRPR
ncbi:MAG: PQQ-binding-like beta-propeller repeat protein, partial [Vicinamibacteria bacterium]